MDEQSKRAVRKKGPKQLELYPHFEYVAPGSRFCATEKPLEILRGLVRHYLKHVTPQAKIRALSLIETCLVSFNFPFDNRQIRISRIFPKEAC
jgi:hypothetical protein